MTRRTETRRPWAKRPTVETRLFGLSAAAILAGASPALAQELVIAPQHPHTASDIVKRIAGHCGSTQINVETTQNATGRVRFEVGGKRMTVDLKSPSNAPWLERQSLLCEQGTVSWVRITVRLSADGPGRFDRTTVKLSLAGRLLSQETTTIPADSALASL